MKLKNITMIAAAALMFTACNEDSFLDNKPQGVLSDEVMQSSEGADLLTNAAYAELMGLQANSVWTTPMTNWSYGSVRADDAYKGGGGVGDVDEIHRMEIMTIDATLPNTDAKWYHLYCSVQRCNAALRLLNKCTDEQVRERAYKIQEMKALRAYFYFELSRMFNRIVWFDENYEGNVADLSNVEYTRDQILEMIATEFENAAAVLPESFSDLGRINKYNAIAMAAKVNLYRAYKQDEQTHKVTGVDNTLMQKVVSLCDQIINSGRYGLLDNFQDLDKVATGDNSREGVFQVQYSMYDGSPDAGRINWSNLLNTPVGPYHGDGFFLPSQDLIDAFQTDANGLPLFDTYYQQHFDSDFTFTEVETDGIKETFATCTNRTANVDPRVDFIVGRPEITWKTYTESPYKNTWVRNQGDYGYHSCKRFFVSPESNEMFNGWPWGASALNWNIVRYANVLLWKAEALIEMGQDLDQARQLINQVRARAARQDYWVRDFNDPTKFAANYKIAEYPAAGWTQDYARKALRFETRLETAMEGERFFDLVRWGIAAETMNAYYAREKGARVYYTTAQFQAGRDEYFPISNTQYNLSNGSYTQNPGYGDF